MQLWNFHNTYTDNYVIFLNVFDINYEISRKKKYSNRFEITRTWRKNAPDFFLIILGLSEFRGFCRLFRFPG